MLVIRGLAYLASSAYLLLALPGTGEAFSLALEGLVAAARAGQEPARLYLIGAVAFLPVAWLLRGRLPFWYALSHELSHSIAVTLLGGHPGALAAHASGEGEVRMERMPVALWLVLLSPYVFNPSMLPSLVVPWLSPAARPAGAAVAGAGLGFALVCNALQVRAYQTDIREAGLVRSLLFIAWGNLGVAALSAGLVLGGYGLAWKLLKLAVWPPLWWR